MNIIIVSDVPPDVRYTAGQVLNKVISSLPEFEFRFYWLNQSQINTQVEIPPNCSIMAIVDVAYGRSVALMIRACNFVIRVVPLFAKLAKSLKAMIALVSLLKTVLRFGFMLRRDPSKLVWFVVQGERSVVAYKIMSWIARKPYLLQQWDPLSWWMGQRQYSRGIIRVVQDALSRLEEQALMNIVPSEIWREQLAAQGKSVIRLDNFIQQESLERRFLALHDPSVLHAVFVGQFYASKELVRIVSTLAETVRRSGRELVIHLFGSSTPVSLANCQIVSHGYLDQNELIQRISKWELALLPYPTAVEYEETARLSFPSKARVYLAAGLPVLACAPAFSGIHCFLEQHYANHYCNIEVTSDSSKFVQDLLDANYQKRQTRFDEARKLVESEFSDTVELLPLRNIIGGAV